MSTQAPPAILSVGRLYCDLIFTGLPRLPSLGTELFAEGFGVHAGGGAFITAAHLAALGHVSALATMLPSSAFSDLIRTELEASGVDFSLCKALPETAGPQLTVAMVQGGDRAFLTRRAGPAFPPLSAGDLQRRGIGHIHVGEITTLAAHPELLDLARAGGLTLSADCGWDDALDHAALAPLRGRIDLFLPNDAEWTLMQQMGLADGFAPLTVVKKGAQGATALGGATTLDAPTTPIDALDTTGAGDAFNAGFLSRWLAGADLSDCLAAGNARGALAVRQCGGFAVNETA